MLLIWNLAHGLGPAGLDPHLRAAVEVLRAVNPDVALLGEVDRASDRTKRVDQHEILVRALAPACDASVSAHRSPYVPLPLHAPLGRVDAHVSALARCRIEAATRWQLPRGRGGGWLQRQLGERRPLLQLDLPVVGGGWLRVFHAPLARRGPDDTLPRQLAVVAQHLAEANREEVPWLLAAELPPTPGSAPLAGLRERFGAARVPDLPADHDPLVVFASPRVPVEQVSALREAAGQGHVPVLVTIRVPLGS